jgi:hypothetical protein
MQSTIWNNINKKNTTCNISILYRKRFELNYYNNCI